MGRPSRTYLLAERFYPSTCIETAIDQFQALCSIQRRAAGDHTELTITPLQGCPDEVPEEFMNFLLCASLEKLLA